MFKALLRTVGVFGTIFAAGYVARRYFGWEPEKLVDQAKDKFDDLRRDRLPHGDKVKQDLERKAV